MNSKSSYKWISRFLKCKYFDPSSLAECMLTLILGRKPPPRVIVLVDQTTIDGVDVVNAAIPLQGRAVPVAWIDFEYPWKTLTPPSQNTIERYLLTWLAEAAPRTRLILIFERGYARVELNQRSESRAAPFLIRAPHKVIVQATVRGRRQRLSLGRLPHRTNWPVRYGHVLYHSQKAERVDVIVYRERGFQQPWFLVVPPDSESCLPTARCRSRARFASDDASQNFSFLNPKTHIDNRPAFNGDPVLSPCKVCPSWLSHFKGAVQPRLFEHKLGDGW